MQWLIFGATGYTGGALLNGCIRHNYNVWAHLRPTSSRRAGVEQLCADHSHATAHHCPFERSEIGDLVAAAAPTHIALCLGTTRAHSKQAQKRGERHGYNQIDRDLSLMVIEAAKQEASEACICYVSSMGADKPRGNAYLKARYDVEQALMSSGLRYMIVRPAFISGSDRQEFRFGERAGAVIGDSVLSLGAMVGFKKMAAAYRSMSAEELAKGILAAAESDEPAQLLYPQHLRHQMKMRYD